VYELGWRAWFRHAWARRGEGILKSLHAGPRPDDAYASALPDDVREARTGINVVDQAVRTLYASGTLHNHARMWLASYLVHLRHVHWRTGADWMVAHLLDGDLASNHLSWQWVAGTGSARPYLFDAANVARHAPPSWHVPGSVLDTSYDALFAAARAALPLAGPGPSHLPATPEPPRLDRPPAGLDVLAASGLHAAVQGRDVWLVHPWALRAPPPHLPANTLSVGLYVAEQHCAWPWNDARWHWVDAAMRNVTHLRAFGGAGSLAQALACAASVRSVAEPHLAAWLPGLAQLDAADEVFPAVDRPCTSFSQWWTLATRGLRSVRDLLA
jgi:deoxyribodipyrimidine photo-lyase